MGQFVLADFLVDGIRKAEAVLIRQDFTGYANAVAFFKEIGQIRLVEP